jgi:hypothetical protein
MEQSFNSQVINFLEDMKIEIVPLNNTDLYIIESIK